MDLAVASVVVGISTVAVIIYGCWCSKAPVTTEPANPIDPKPDPKPIIDATAPVATVPTANPDAPVAVPTANPADPVAVPTANPTNPVADPVADPVAVPALHVLLIEADNQHSLGGACLRDCLTADKYLTNYLSEHSTKNTQGCKMLLSIDGNTTSRKFTSKDMIFDKLSNYEKRFTEFTSKVAINDTVLILISGHGYQQKSKTTEEIDGLDEYICHDNGIILDNEINELLLNKLTAARRVICIADTCHSGTIFDNSNYTNIFSISACLDKESAYNDVGGNTGFGGALTVHLFDQDNASNILIAGNITDIKNLISTISKIIAPLRQTPLYVGPNTLPL